MDAEGQLVDDLGDGEWDRFDKDALSRVSLEVYFRCCAATSPRAAYVLEIGAGPGRLTIELARMVSASW